MARKRDTNRYRLKDGNKIVYVGITNDPERRAREHHVDRMKFTKMEVIGPKVTEDSAKKWEEENIKKYRRNTGKNPKYNKKVTG